MNFIGKNINKKDKYGNYLLSDEAFEIGVDGIKAYLSLFKDEAEYHKKTPHEFLRNSNIYIDALIESASDAIEKAGLNPNYDITERDFEEMIKAATGQTILLDRRTTAAGFECWCPNLRALGRR